MSVNPRKICLPEYVVTEMTDEGDAEAIKISLPNDTYYFIRPKFVKSDPGRRDAKPKWVTSTLNTYPIVMQGDGAPWDEANLYIFKKLENSYVSNMSTVTGIAEDLVAYRRFLEDEDIDWQVFPSHKNAKPTYRYRSHLNHEVWDGRLKPSTAKRRMGVIIRFYRWLMDQKLFTPDNQPWKDQDKFVSIRGDCGQPEVMRVKSTDLRITIQEQDNPYDGCIEDGGKLRPMSPEKQDWLMDALETLGNTEMMLIHMFALLTGARIQTILTFKVRDALKIHSRDQQLIYAVGPGTGIDTKNDKKLALYIPVWFYEMLQVYALSERARKRRHLAIGGDNEHQYLFLSVRGTPMYVSKQDKTFVLNRQLRHRKSGQAVRQYMTDYIIPFIQTKYDQRFHYQFHDLRATYGMNLVDQQARNMDNGQITYTAVLNFVRARLCHESPVTTERYLSYRANQKLARTIQDEWEMKLRQMVHRAMGRADDKI